MRTIPPELSSRADPRSNPGLDHVEAWIFDLDNTLYPASCNLFHQIDWRMTEFIADRLALARDDARRLQKELFRRHGTTLAGLMAEHAMDPAPFLAYVHDIDLSPVAPAPALDRALAALPGRKLVFTNGSTRHAENVLARLGVTQHFETVFDIAAADFVPKPRPEPYRALLERHAIEPSRALMAEDIARNLIPAAALGMTTLWVRGDAEWARAGADEAHVHFTVDDLAGWLASIGEQRRAAP
jgi:putative hydrolase of the HAD superfamily